MKIRVFAALLAACMLLTGLAVAEDAGLTKIKGTLTNGVKLQDEYPDNPVIDGVSPTTGLPASGEVYTPILMVVDGGPDANPHWGLIDADIIFQVANAGAGATKYLALFGDHYPEEAGGARSGRATMVPVAKAWDAAFAYAGPPATKGSNVAIHTLMSSWGMYDQVKRFNLLGRYAHRVDYLPKPHNLSVEIGAIHAKLIEDGVSFEARRLRFSDTPRTNGEEATYIRVVHRGDTTKKPVNASSTNYFTYNESLGGYTRVHKEYDDVDRFTNEPLVYSNVIVMRIKFKYQDNYIYYQDHMVGSGTAEIFQNGRYVQGAWYRKDQDSRLVFVDENGEELEFQRGKSFIVISNDATGVAYR